MDQGKRDHASHCTHCNTHLHLHPLYLCAFAGQQTQIHPCQHPAASTKSPARGSRAPSSYRIILLPGDDAAQLCFGGKMWSHPAGAEAQDRAPRLHPQGVSPSLLAHHSQHEAAQTRSQCQEHPGSRSPAATSIPVEITLHTRQLGLWDPTSTHLPARAGSVVHNVPRATLPCIHASTQVLVTASPALPWGWGCCQLGYCLPLGTASFPDAAPEHPACQEQERVTSSFP